MIFRPDMIPAILDGRKTQTRRPVKPGELVVYNAGGRREVLSADGRTKWLVGHRYSVCPGRGKKGVGFIFLVWLDRERVDEISNADARAEGFASRQAFLARWRELYPKSDLAESVWVLEFERG